MSGNNVVRGGGFTFLHVCDSHLGTPRSYRFRPAVNRRWAAIKRQLAATDAAFLLHGGDLTRDGGIHEEEYALARADLDTLPFPTFVVPGNMDVGNKHTAQMEDRWPDAETRVGFHRCEVTDSGIEAVFVPGEDQCEEFGTYGPWGHPLPEERDYSLAREMPALTPR